MVQGHAVGKVELVEETAVDLLLTFCSPHVRWQEVPGPQQKLLTQAKKSVLKKTSILIPHRQPLDALISQTYSLLLFQILIMEE